MKPKYYIGLIILALIVILIPFSVRLLTNPSYPGDEAYYHLIVVEHLLNKKDVSEIHYDGATLVTPYHLFLTLLSLFIGTSLTFAITPLLVGLFTLLFFFLILKKLRIQSLQVFIILLFFIFSPIFLYSSYFINTIAFYLLLSLIGFYLLLSQMFILSFIVYLSLIFSDIFVIISNIVILLSYFYFGQKQKKKTAIIFLVLILGSLGYGIYLIIQYGIPVFLNFSSRNIIKDYLVDLGGLISFSTFGLVLFFFGLYFLRHRKNIFLPLLLSMIVLFLLSLFSVSVNVFSNIFIVSISGYAFVRFLTLKWSLKLMKRVAIVILLLGILLSAYTYGTRIINETPSSEMVESLVFLRDQDGIVLSHYSIGHIIQQISEHHVFLDSHFMFQNDIKQKHMIADLLFHSQDLQRTRQHFTDNNINFIYIDPQTRERVWSSSEEGLLYLFRNNETFKNIYRKDSIEIWYAYD